ncbi:7285_t:CDS:1, partial [Gigaspora margarita]
DDETSKISVNPRRPAICGFHIHKDTWDIFFDNPDRINPYHSELSTCSFFNFTFCAYFRKRNNYPLGHPPPPHCFCGIPVVMRFSARDRRLMFVCRNYLIDGARPKCTWHVYADQVAFEKPKGCTHQMFKKQVTVGLVEPENEKTITNNNSSLNDSKNDSSDQLYIDPRGPVISYNGKNRQVYPRNKNNNYSGNGKDLDYHSQDSHSNCRKSYHHSPIRDDPPDSNSVNARLKDDDNHIGSSSQTSLSSSCDSVSQPHTPHQKLLKNNDEISEYVSQLEASNKDLLDKVSKLEADKKCFSEKAASLEAKMNYLTYRLEHYRSKCESETEMKQSCQKKVMELQCHITDVSRERDNLKSSWDKEREERVSATHKCKVCFSEPITHAIYPCYHMALCGTCVEIVDKCVICRQDKKSAIRIYIQ